MNQENTNEPLSKTAVKSRFFAQYWEQDIIHVNMIEWVDRTRVVDAITMESDSFKKFSLYLTHISKITDEDAIYVAQLITKFNWDLDLGTKVIREENQIRIYYDAKISGFKHTTTIYDDFFGRNYLGEPIQPLSGEIFDYLRSKGYAVPFMEYSVEDLISFGWVQLL